jgi:hypothetical protein
MLQKILAAVGLDNADSLKRAIATAIGAIVTLGINPLLASRGLPTIPAGVLQAVAGLLATFVLQSGVKSAAQHIATAKAAGQAASGQVITLADAKAVIEANKPVTP